MLQQTGVTTIHMLSEQVMDKNQSCSSSSSSSSSTQSQLLLQT